MLIERVDQRHEPRRLVAHVGTHDGNADQDYGVKTLRDGEIVRCAPRLAAEPLEGEDGDALQRLGNMKRAARADRQFHRGHRAALHLVIRQPEEGIAQRCGRFGPVRHVPQVEPLHAVEAIVGRAIEGHHLHLRLDQADEGHEQLAVESVLVKIGRRTVRRGDDPDPGIDQRREQPAHDHRVGAVGDHHLVKGKKARFFRNVGGHLQQRFVDLGVALDLQAGVDVEHEGVEMRSALRLGVDRLEGEVHQHRFSAPDAAPHVDAARRRGLAAEQAAEEPLARAAQILGETVERLDRMALVGIRLEFARLHQRRIGLADVAGHLVSRGSRTRLSVPWKS